MNISSDPITPRAEAEVKIALSAKEFANIPKHLLSLGFAAEVSSDLVDYYLNYTQSELGGWNFLRLRTRDSASFLLTRKEWVRDAKGNAIRLEDEHPITDIEARQLLAASPDALTLNKTRHEFHGNIQHESASIVLDHLLLSGKQYYFLECEVMTTPERAQQVRDMLFNWMRSKLAVQANTEALSMLELLRRSVSGEL